MIIEAVRPVSPELIPGVFDHSITWEDDVWKADPFDVEDVHQPARRKFRDLLSAVTRGGSPVQSRILLFHGQSGAGKTHLVRALRTQAHRAGNGYFGYAQMTPDVASYADYFLRRLVNSLEKPYHPDERRESGLLRLANRLVLDAGSIEQAALDQLREAPLDDEALAQLVVRLADRILAAPRFAGHEIDINIVRALLYLQRNDPSIDQRVRHYLYGREFTELSRAAVRALDPQRGPDRAFEIIECLGRLMFVVDRAAMIFCIDQVEDLRSFEDGGSRFKKAVDDLIQLANRVPTSIVVISCLDDFYEYARGQIGQSSVDRVEKAGPVRLDGARNAREARLIIDRRLGQAYAAEGKAAPSASLLFGERFLDELAGLSTRKLLEHTHARWQELLGAPRLETHLLPTEPDHESVEAQGIKLRWEQFQQNDAPSIELDDDKLLAVLGQALGLATQEIDDVIAIDVGPVTVDDDLAAMDLKVHHRPSGHSRASRLFICNRSNQGGGLKRQIERAAALAGSRVPVIVRGSEFPAMGKGAVGQLMERLAATQGVQFLRIGAWEWERMLQLLDFGPCAEPTWPPGFIEWLRTARPMGGELPSIGSLLQLDLLAPHQGSGAAEAAVEAGWPARDNVIPFTARPEPVAARAAEASEPVDSLPPMPSEQEARVMPPENDAERFLIGQVIGAEPDPIILSKHILRRHAAVLGGSGSGKTTLALSVIENLLQRGIPVVLIDRKGDLCSYANPDVWRAGEGESPARQAGREALLAAIDCAVYTPGRTSGRPINITLLPGGIAELPEHEQQMLANVSAAALGEMLYLRRSATHQRQSGILSVALKVLGSRSRSEIRLGDLIRFLEEDNEELNEMTQRMDATGKARRDLISQLDSLRHRNAALFEGHGEPLSMEALLGKGPGAPAGKTRLSIIYTGFLGDNENVLFWVSQFLTEALRFCQRNPSERLQAVVMFDEADLYIPAGSKPPTKEPLESLLKRARSAGIGVMLATQSPGDLDYRSRDQITSWFIGRVREDTALKKLRAAFQSESGLDPARVLPNQTVGEFHLIQEGKVKPMKANRSLVSAEQVPFDRIEQLARATRKAGNQQLKLDL